MLFCIIAHPPCRPLCRELRSEANIAKWRAIIDKDRTETISAYFNFGLRYEQFTGTCFAEITTRDRVYGAHLDPNTQAPRMFWWLSADCISAVHRTALKRVMYFEASDAGLTELYSQSWCMQDDPAISAADPSATRNLGTTPAPGAAERAAAALAAAAIMAANRSIAPADAAAEAMDKCVGKCVGKCMGTQERVDKCRLAWIAKHFEEGMDYRSFAGTRIELAHRERIYPACFDLNTNIAQLFWWRSPGYISAVHHASRDHVMHFEDSDAGLAEMLEQPWCTLSSCLDAARAQEAVMRKRLDSGCVAWIKTHGLDYQAFEGTQIELADHNVIYGAHFDTHGPQMIWWRSPGCISAVHHTARDKVMHFENTDAGLADLYEKPWVAIADDEEDLPTTESAAAALAALPTVTAVAAVAAAEFTRTYDDPHVLRYIKPWSRITNNPPERYRAKFGRAGYIYEPYTEEGFRSLYQRVHQHLATAK